MAAAASHPRSRGAEEREEMDEMDERGLDPLCLRFELFPGTALWLRRFVNVPAGGASAVLAALRAGTEAVFLDPHSVGLCSPPLSLELSRAPR
jgi:hypothetical protein